jgi:hypothetical protein
MFFNGDRAGMLSAYLLDRHWKEKPILTTFLCGIFSIKGGKLFSKNAFGIF